MATKKLKKILTPEKGDQEYLNFAMFLLGAFAMEIINIIIKL